MKVSVDTERCCAAGMCALTAPAVFDQNDDDGRVVLLEVAPPPALHELVEEAAELCPSGAITLSPGSGPAR